MNAQNHLVPFVPFSCWIKSYNFIKSSTPEWVFFTFFELYKCYQIALAQNLRILSQQARGNTGLREERQSEDRGNIANEQNDCDTFLDLLRFVQSKKREKHLWKRVTFNKAETLLKVRRLYECFLSFLNCINGTKRLV